MPELLTNGTIVAPAGSAGAPDTIARARFDPAAFPAQLAAARPVPEIDTPRLRLRGFRAEDHPALHALFSRPESFAFSHRPPMASDESWSRLLRHIGHWVLLGFGLFAVEEKDSGALIGEVGLADFRRGVGDRFDGVPEASWTIAPHAWGRGYAQEAAVAAHKWIDSEARAACTVCMIHEDNARSIQVARKLGYEPFDALSYRGQPTVLLKRWTHGNS